MLFNAFSFDKSGNLVQLDDMLARQPIPPSPSPQPVDPDVIGGRKYKTVQIGNQIWLAENLDLRWDGLRNEVTIDGSDLWNVQNATYFNNDESTYGKDGLNYGLLYSWGAAKYLHEHENELCPGWRVPSSEDFQTLINKVREDVFELDSSGFSTQYLGKALASTTGWNYNKISGPPGITNDPIDLYGFNAKPAGIHLFSTYYQDSPYPTNADGVGKFTQYLSYVITKEYNGKPSEYDGMAIEANLRIEPTASRPSTENTACSIRLVRDAP